MPACEIISAGSRYRMVRVEAHLPKRLEESERGRIQPVEMSECPLDLGDAVQSHCFFSIEPMIGTDGSADPEKFSC